MITLTPEQLHERGVRVANDLAAWINKQPFQVVEDGSTSITPVYDAHVLLCELLRKEYPDGATPNGVIRKEIV